jgi:hypothetical protein
LKAGTLTVSVEFRSPESALQLLVGFLDEFAALSQEVELRKIATNRQFVEEELRKASDPIIVAKLQFLLSEQVERAMMARNVERLAYELIDPPSSSDKKVKPSRVLIAAFGLTASFLGGVLLAFLAEWVSRVRRGAASRPSRPSESG